jgi:branched-chain amino acid transport system substrate-binding protein
VACVGYCDSDYVLAAAPALEAHGIPFVTSGATDPDLPKQIGKSLFLTTFSDDDQAFAIADFAYTSLKIRSVAIWSDKSTEFTRVLCRFFKDRFLDIGGTIASEDVFLRKRKDFSALISKLRNSTPPPDAVFVSDASDEAVAIVSQLRKAGVTIPILSGDGFDVDLVSTLSDPKLADDIYFSTHSYRGDTRDKVISFTESYRKKYGKDPESAFAVLGYDAVDLVADALKRCGTTGAPALTQALEKTTAFESLTGPVSYARPNRIPAKAIAIIGVKKGKYEVLGTVRPY